MVIISIGGRVIIGIISIGGMVTHEKLVKPLKKEERGIFYAIFLEFGGDDTDYDIVLQIAMGIQCI